MEKLTIVLPSVLTVPAIRGGAVEQLLEDFIKVNEEKRQFECTVIAHYIKGVEKYKKKYKYTKFIYIKYPTLLIRINSIVNNLIFNIPDIYAKIILSKIIQIGNERVLFEGGRELALELIKKVPSAKIFYHVHGPAYPFRNEGDKDLCKKFYGVPTVSDFCSQEQIKLGMKSEIVCTVRNGIPTSKFYPENIKISDKEIRKKFGLKPKSAIFLFKGRLVEEKGIIELIKAFSMLKDNNIELLIVGSKNFGDKRIIKSKYEKKLNHLLKTDNRIVHINHIDYKYIPLLNKIAYCAVVPSIWEEPGALVVLEAIAAGNPIVMSDSGGMPEYTKGLGCFIVKRGNLNQREKFINNLYEALDKILKDEAMYQNYKKELKLIRYDYNEYNYYNNLANLLKIK